MRALESTHEHWLRQVLRFERQQASLELGFLTEELIDRKELMQIIKSGRRAGFYAPNINWFYSNIRIAPIQWTGRQLVCPVSEVNTPLSSSVTRKDLFGGVLLDASIHETIISGIPLCDDTDSENELELLEEDPESEQDEVEVIQLCARQCICRSNYA